MNPISIKHFNAADLEKNPNDPQRLAGWVKSLDKYIDKSFKLEQAPHLPWKINKIIK